MYYEFAIMEHYSDSTNMWSNRILGRISQQGDNELLEYGFTHLEVDIHVAFESDLMHQTNLRLDRVITVL